MTFYEKLGNIFEKKYDLLDYIEIPTEVKLSKKCYFQATYDYDGIRMTKRLNHKKGCVIIDRTLFQFGDRQLEPRDVILSIEYVDDDGGKIAFVKDEVELNVIPLDISATAAGK